MILEERSPSLTSRLLRGLVGPMAILSLLLALGGAWTIHKLVEGVNDRLLSASARHVAETLALEDGDITVDFPAPVLGMLENELRDNIYYSVRHGDRLITGYGDLPRVEPADFTDGGPVFRYERYRGYWIRMVAEMRRVPRVEGVIIVQVAETLEARKLLGSRMLAALALLEGALLVLVAFMLPVAVRWGLAPLRRLRGEMDMRMTSDFTPLSTEGVPRELRDLVTAFNALLGRLDVAVEGMRRFTADASHQMRTPLSILRTHISVLKAEEPYLARPNGSLADIEAATDRLQRLLIQLLTLARADGANASSLELVQLDLRPLVRHAAGELIHHALEARVDLDFDVAEDQAFPALAHPVLVGELVGNLMDNAIRYNKPGGTVTIRMVLEEQRTIVIVEDDGPGIPASDREKVFTRFYRLSRDQDQAGSGLGLSIVNALARTLDATITLDAGSNGKGLRVVVAFLRA